MSEITAAKQSPRIENGILKWYVGDTFELDFDIELTDHDGEDISIAATSEIKAVFKNRKEETVKEFSFTGIEDNSVTLVFDAACSALFPKGEYHYRIYYTAGERTTLCADNLCVVE